MYATTSVKSDDKHIYFSTAYNSIGIPVRNSGVESGHYLYGAQGFGSRCTYAG